MTTQQRPKRAIKLSNYDAAFNFVVGAEGGYGCDPEDRGNWTSGKCGTGELRGTKYGISAMSYPALDIESITLAEAKRIYRDDYWYRIKANVTPYGMGLVMFDCAVNQGLTRAIRFAQASCGAKVDGCLGSQSRRALGEVHPDDFIDKFMSHRTSHYKGLRQFPRYGKGWLNRLAHVQQEVDRWRSGIS